MDMSLQNSGLAIPKGSSATQQSKPFPSAVLHGVNVLKGARSRIDGVEALLRTINNSVSMGDRPDLASFVNWKGNADAPIHRWLRYREAYSPHLITKLALGDRILDPFCGCGSTLIGAAERGYSSVGIDVNPLAVFATKVKLTPLSPAQLSAIKQFMLALPEDASMEPAWELPGLSIANKVFEPGVLGALLPIRSLYERQFHSDPASRDFLHLAWVAILESVGSYFKEGNGIKYRNKKRLKTGYVQRLDGEWQEQRFGSDQQMFVREAFCSHVEMMLQDAKYWK